jgi:hypothetical protein
MYYKTMNKIALKAFPQYNKPDFSIYDLPSAQQQVVRAIGDTTDLLGKIESIMAVMKCDKPKFYANEVDLCGGSIGGLSRNGVVKATGTVKEIMVCIDDNLYRKCEIKEWELALPKEDLQAIVSATLEYLYNLTV